jgi:trehalose/maltose transport system substrate-binding protein
MTWDCPTPIPRQKMKRLRLFSASGGTALAILLLTLLEGSCASPSRAPVTLSYFRLGWSQPDELPSAESLSQKFIRETGIHLKNLPVPENTLDQLALSKKVLEGASGPDALGVDMVWSGVLAEELIDLRAAFEKEIPSLAPQLLLSYTVNGKLVAIPYAVQVGVLEYRADLLRAYHYDHPPKTWDELESMSARIQAGERAKGKNDFWGYVWQGADAEALTCNALEWQAAGGGGQIIENDRTISVNNPAAIQAWERAKSWIGRISPPGVIAYRESDSINAFDSGRAVFNRVWGGTKITRSGMSPQLHWRSSLEPGKTGYTSMPSGSLESAGTLGGSGLAISRHSMHPQEAIQLVRFLIRTEIQASEREEHPSGIQPEVYHRPSISEAISQRQNGVVSRPSSMTGAKYEQVTRAYISAVHSVLTGDAGAPEAAADLERRLVAMTGFRTGPPKVE